MLCAQFIHEGTACVRMLVCRRSEIARHIQPGALKVVVYSGQAQPGPGEGGDNEEMPSSFTPFRIFISKVQPLVVTWLCVSYSI